jgi:hypothetical protein
MRRHGSWIGVMVLLMMGAASPAAQFGWLPGGGNKNPEFKPFEPPSQRYTVEYPTKDWNSPVAATTSVVFMQKKSEAVVSIESSTLAVALEPGDINETIAGYEIEHIKSQMPKADGFKPQLQGDAKRRVIVIEYNRPSIKGGAERVRQYSYIVGKDVYRISCSAAPQHFTKYEPIFTHVVSSFKVAGT